MIPKKRRMTDFRTDLPSGAGHDAMKLHEVMPQAMLFMRGLNAGISHNPLEGITNHDAELCVRAFQYLLEQLAADRGPTSSPSATSVQ